MPRNADIDIPRLVDGDEVTDGRGNFGFARQCTNKATGEKFIGVFITDGPARKTWGKAYQFNPLLDHEGGSIQETCSRCERPFLATARVVRVGELESKEVAREHKCRTCTGHSRTEVQRERDRRLDATSDHIRKTKHHAVPGRDQ